jgi:tetratricopeptide (TPR) repeat protein
MDEVVLQRADALRSFEDVASHRVAIVAAPEGFGKSTLVRELNRDAFAILEIGADSTFERFVSSVVRHAGPLARGISRSITRVYARALEREDGPAVLAAWFSRYLAGVSRVLVVDGADAASDPRISAFLHAAIAASAPAVRWVLVGRDVERLRAFLPDDAEGAIVGEDRLRLSFPELKALAIRLAPRHTSGELFVIARKSAGSISRAVFLLRCLHYGVPTVADGSVSLESLLDRCFADLSERERLETMAGILLEDGGNVQTGALANQVSSVFSRLRTTAPFLFEPDERSLQACFRARLRRETRVLIAQNQTDLFVRAADALEANGDTASAVALYCAVDAVDRLLAVVERRGGVGLEGEQMHVLREAIDLIPEDVRERHPLVVGLRAVDAANRGRHAEAAQLFESALGLCAPGDRNQSIRYWYASLGVLTGDTPLVQRLLRPSVEFFRTPPPLRAAMMALLGVSLAMSGEGDRANNWSARARKVSDACNDDALAARVYQQAAFVALRRGSLDEAHLHGTRAVAFAEACGWPHVAAITYGILHHIAVERDRHDQIGLYARRLAENAARSGNVPLQYLAVAACYEHAVECCDLPAVAELRAELEQFDVAGSPATFDFGRPEMPAKALELAWDGRFGTAYRHLEPLLAEYEKNPSDAASEPQVFADAAVYAAAAGMAVEANRALRLYRSAAVRERGNGNALRARIAEAFSLWLLGKERESKHVMRSVFTHLPLTRSRLRIYAELISSIIDRAHTFAGPEPLPLEDEMYASGWGGLARLARSVLAATRAAPEVPRKKRATG